MQPKRLPNGDLLVPKRAETGRAVGDALVRITPGDPDYAAWLAWFNSPRRF